MGDFIEIGDDFIEISYYGKIATIVHALGTKVRHSKIMGPRKGV